MTTHIELGVKGTELYSVHVFHAFVSQNVSMTESVTVGGDRSRF